MALRRAVDVKVQIVWAGPSTPAEASVIAKRQVPLLERLRQIGVDARVVLCGDRGSLAERVEAARIPVDVIPVLLPPAPAALAAMPAAVARLRPLVRRAAADLVEGDEPMPAIAAALACGVRRRRPLVYRRHHAGGARRLLLASRLAACLADRTIVSSETMRRQASADDRTPLDRIDVASSGTPEPRLVSSDELAEARRQVGLLPNARVLTFVGRLRHEKGVDVFLQALGQLRDLEDVHALVVGDGPERSKLEEAARGQRVHFLGHRDDVDRWFALADVVVVPSRRETFGRVPLEAMALGRPVVASRVGGLVEAVVDNETGLLVPPEDPTALATKLRTLLSQPALANALGEAGRAHCRARHTLEHMATSWRSAWERALVERR